MSLIIQCKSCYLVYEFAINIIMPLTIALKQHQIFLPALSEMSGRQGGEKMQVDSIRKLLRYSSRNGGHSLHNPAGMTAVPRKRQHTVIKSNLLISYPTKAQQSHIRQNEGLLLCRKSVMQPMALFLYAFLRREKGGTPWKRIFRPSWKRRCSKEFGRRFIFNVY